MKLVGFNFSKISIEKIAEVRPKDLKMGTKINVSEIKSLKSEFFKTKEDILASKFTYIINYDPSYAKVEFEGTIILAVDPKLAKVVLKQWKEKKMPQEFNLVLFNLIMMKSNIKALQLEEELNIPYHVPLPTLKPESIKQDPEKKKK